MIARSARLLSPLLCLPLSLLVACGDAGGPATDAIAPQSRTVSGVEIAGNVLHHPAGGSILVFAMAGSNEPASVGILGEDGGFSLSALPPAPLELVFLDDKASDGVIDEGDPVATLADPQLRSLQEGDSVRLSDVKLNFRARSATAGGIEIVHAGGSAEPAVAATPTPAPEK